MNAPISAPLPLSIPPHLLEEYPELARITVEILEVTPEYAKEDLEKRSKNDRNKSRKFTTHYAGVMKAFGWQLNGETICYDWDGFRLNGRHRMESCVESNTPFITFVIRGLNPKVVTSYDTGNKRSTRDVLSMNGFVEAKTSVVARLLMDYEGLQKTPDRINTRLDYEHVDILNFCTRHPQVDISTASCADFAKHWSKTVTPAISLAFFHLTTQAGFTKEDVNAFLHKISLGADARFTALAHRLGQFGRATRSWPWHLAALIAGFNHIVSGAPLDGYKSVKYPKVIKAKA